MKLYKAFVETDARIAEVNPLVVNERRHHVRRGLSNNAG